MKTEFKTSSIDIVKILKDKDVRQEFGDAVASFLRNETVVWTKFVLTDDVPNGNKMRIPHEEFPNLMDSGLHMPFKMAFGEINRGHDGAFPLGTIAHIKEEEIDGRHLLVGLAALWSKERPEDVLMFKSAMASEKKPQVSWEILYGDYSSNEDGTIDLKDTSLSGVTVVGDPAYEGRTPVLAVAAKQWSRPYLEELPEDAFMHIGEDGERLFPYKDADGRVDPSRLNLVLGELANSSLPSEVIEEYRERVKDLQAKLESGASLDNPSLKKSSKSNAGKTKSEENKLDELTELKNKVAELEQALSEAKNALTTKETQLTENASLLTEQEKELTELREFKAAIDAEAEKQVKLDEIKQKFQEAGIEKDDSYFDKNSEYLLGMDESARDFLLQELVAFSSKKDDEEDGKESKASKLPRLDGVEQEDDASIEGLAKALRERDAK